MDVVSRINHLLELSRPLEALELVRVSLATSPHDVDLLVWGGWTHLALPDPAGALWYLDAAIAQDPDRVDAHAARSQALLDIRYLSAAEDAARTAVGLTPWSAPMHAQLARVLSETARSDEACRHAEHAVALDPSNADMHFVRGVVSTTIDPAAAIGAYREALRLDPSHVDAMNNLAILECRSPVALVRVFHAALTQDPRNGVVRTNLIETLNRLAWLAALAPLGFFYLASRAQVEWLAVPGVVAWAAFVAVVVWRMPASVRRALPEAMIPMWHRARRAFTALGLGVGLVLVGAVVASAGPSS